MRRRVVITGMGAITPLGHSAGELFASQIDGRTAVDDFKKELRWNQAYYHLARGL